MLSKREKHLQNQMDEQDAIARKNVSSNKGGEFIMREVRASGCVCVYTCICHTVEAEQPRKKNTAMSKKDLRRHQINTITQSPKPPSAAKRPSSTNSSKPRRK